MDAGRLREHLLGGGSVQFDGQGGARLVIPPTERGYCDAQLDDYGELPRSQFAWSAPASLRLRARASQPSPPGTLGFGFWNDPFGISLSGAGSVRRLPAAPQALWFFHGAPPNDFTFAEGGTGSGWKAASLRSIRYPAAVLIPGGAAAFALGALPYVRRWIVPLVRRQASAEEAVLEAALSEWHEYSLTWLPDRAVFEVDGSIIAELSIVPHGPLGFVVWIDNQYAVLSEDKGIRFGLLPTNTEYWLDLEGLDLRHL